MKKYVLTLFSSKEAEAISKYYNNWDYEMIRNLDKNFEGYQKFRIDWIDLVYILGKYLNSPEEFGFVLSTDVYITKDWVHYWNYLSKKFEIIPQWSEILCLRIWWFNDDFLKLLKLMGKEKFNITVKWLDSVGNNIGLKWWWLYYWYKSGLEDKIPNTVIAALNDYVDKDIFMEFLKDYFNYKSIIIKRIKASWGKEIYIYDLKDPKSLVSLKATIINFITHNIKDVVIMELIDTKEYEIRLLWTKMHGEVEIIALFKKVRLWDHILHNISQWNDIWLAKVEELPEWFIEDVKKLCQCLSTNHGWMDIIFDKMGNYYFTESNKMTGYMESEIEYPFLEKWFQNIADIYK